MATCIVSRAMQLDGATALSGILLVAGIVAYVVLAAVYAGRFAVNRAGVRADATDPGRAFGFFTLAAGSDVLAARLAAGDSPAAATVLLGGGRYRIPARRGPGDGRTAGLSCPPPRADARVLGLHGRWWRARR
jgi:hypothetical protein